MKHLAKVTVPRRPIAARPALADVVNPGEPKSPKVKNPNP